MPRLKVVEAQLNKLGYVHVWELERRANLPEKIPLDAELPPNILYNTKYPICQNIDIIVPNRPRSNEQLIQLRRFLNIIGDPCEKQTSSLQPETSPIRHNSFVRDDDQRAYLVSHFIETEATYVEKLRVLVHVIALPLRTQSQGRYAILNSFKWANIFLNCEQLLEVNEQFLKQLQQVEKDSFGDICAKNMNAFDCYRKYLLGKKSAQKHQKREYIENQAFRSFLLRAADDPRAKEWKGMLEGLLIEPVQRISRYTLLLQEILQYTPNTHPDWIGLTKTYAKFQDIAMMVDDDLTKLANMLHNLHTSIKDSPCSLINQSRTLVTHLDATEIHRETLKPIRAVTLFLFADKLMIASRPSHQSKGMDILTAKEDKDTSTGSFIPKKLERIRSSQTLKFKGWADIEQIELFDGNQDRPGSFLLRASPAQEQQPAQDQMASEAAAYLHKCPRLFSVVPPKENTSLLDSYIETCKDFIATFQKTQALARRYATTDETFSRTWQTLDTFSNFYTPENYINARYKNNIAIAYVEQGLEFDLKSLASPNNTPWIIGFVQADVRGFRFTLCSKLDLLERNPRHVTNTTEDEKYTNDFHCIFWNNVIMCERQLRYASLFANVHDKTTEEELQKQPRSRSRSRSLSRSTSVATLTKLLIHRSRSTSPSRSQKSPISISSSTPLVRPATDTEQQASHTTTERPPVRRNRAKSMSLDTNLMQLSPRTQKTSKEMLHQVSLSELRPYHLAPRPEASSLPIMNEKDKSHNRRSMPESLWTSNLMKRYSDNDTLRTESPIRYELSDKISAANHSVDKTDTESTHSSSRNNTPSITSAHYSNHNSSPHSSLSNTFSSFTSHSTRSSLSLEDLEVPRNFRPTGYFTHNPNLFTEPVDSDPLDMKIHQQLALQRRTSNSTMNSGSTHREQPSLVPTPHQQPMESMLVDMQQLNKQINGMVYQLIGKYTTLEQCVKTVTDKYQLPPLEEKRLIDLCRELHNDTYTLFNQLNDDVNSMVDRTAAQCHPLLPTPLDASSVSHTSNASDTDMKKKLEQVHLERNYWHKKASELNQRLADSLHR